MRLISGYLATLGSAMLIAGTAGFAVTWSVTAHLLEKNRALIEAGRVALPGADHLNEMLSLDPALAGALFFALVLGFGYGSASFFYGLFWRFAPRRLWILLASPLAVLPIMALARKELGTAAALLLISLCAVALAQSVTGLPSHLRRRQLLIFACSLLTLGIGLFPWWSLKMGPFVKIRDGLLLQNSHLRPLNDFYYKWTLYPAEAIKPLDLSTQPGARVEGALRDSFCPEAWALGIVCMPSGSGVFDFSVDREGDRIALTKGDARAYWTPGDEAANAAMFRNLADDSDPARVLRKSTFLSLFFLTPLSIMMLLGWAAYRAASKPSTILGVSALLAFFIGSLGMPDASDELRYRLLTGKGNRAEIESALNDSSPAMRLYGLRAAGAYGAEFEPILTRALEDEAVNVRYSAATALGELDSPKAREALLKVVAGPEWWYVKFRAYNALAKLGWQP